MKIYRLLILFLFMAVSSQAQTLKKYPISSSGCSFYNYCESKFKLDYSSDSSKVYTGECTVEDITYGTICVLLLNPVTDLVAAEDLLIAYVDYLKSSFSIKKSAGYGKGHRLNNNENTRGILDYWEDGEGDKWKIKAWTDGKYIGFMYAYSSKNLPEAKINVFLEGFRLPATK
ncbi:MAG TPA: hypothetical protein PKX31_02715 [Chitinophagaceae bacterium]|nr:hypothetical protein [Chitinophagaceae bacterium]